jgi:hypothetical protein
MTSMTSRLRSLVPIVVVGCFCASSAGASEPEPAGAPRIVAPAAVVDRFATPALSLEVAGGTNTPAGDWSVGVAAELGRRFAVALSAGEDTSGRHPRFSLGPRLRLLIHGPLALDSSLVLTRAQGEELGTTGFDGTVGRWSFERRWETFYRLQLELGIAYRFGSRFGVRAFGGAGVPLSAGRCRYVVDGPGGITADSCDSPAISEDLRGRFRGFPYAGLSVSVGLTPFGPPPPDWQGLSSRGGWYGWQTLAVDGVAAAGLALTREALYPAIADLTGVALVHTLHRRLGRAAASVAMRAVLVVAGTMIGLAAAGRPNDDDDTRGAGAGAAVGAVTASLLDAALLAHEPPRERLP